MRSHLTSNIIILLILAGLIATPAFAATREWTRPLASGEGFFWDNANWNTPPLSGLDGFRIDKGQAVIQGVDNGEGGLDPYVFQTNGNNYVGFNYGSTEYATLRISDGGTLTTSLPEVINDVTQFYELFIARGVYAGTSNQGRLILEEGGSLRLGYHMAIGRNGAHGRLDMTGGTITRIASGNIYLGWDDNTGQNLESFGEFYQSGGIVNHAGNLYMGTQTVANARASRGYLELSGDAIFQMNNIYVGRQGTGSSGHVEIKDDAYLKANILMLGGDAETYKGPFGTLRMTGNTKIEATTLTVGNSESAFASVFTQESGEVISNNVRIGRNGGWGEYHISNASKLNVNGTLSVGLGTIRFVDGTPIVEQGDGTLKLSNSSEVKATAVHLGNGAKGYLKVTGGLLEAINSNLSNVGLLIGTSFTTTDANTSNKGYAASGDGLLEVTGGTVRSNSIIMGGKSSTDAVGSVGKIIQSNGKIESSNQSLILGDVLGSTGYYEMSGGRLDVGANNHLMIGRLGEGTFTMTGGEVVVTGSVGIGQNTTGVGTLNISNGTITTVNGTGFYVGETYIGNLTVSGDGKIFINPNSANGLTVGRNAGGNGVVNLDGGLIQANMVKRTGGQGVLFFNGGTLQATRNNNDYISQLTSVQIKTGGAVIDTQSYTIGIAQNLLTEAGASSDGGLKKLGTGILRLTGNNTYQGKTEVQMGMLAVGMANSLGSSHWIEVRAGATLDSRDLGTMAPVLHHNAIISGAGTLQGKYSLQSGRSIRIGDSSTGSQANNAGHLVGKLTFKDSLSLEGGSSLWFDLNDVDSIKGAGWDLMVIENTFEVFNASSEKVQVVITEGLGSGFDGTQDYAWEIINAPNSTLSLDLDDFSLDTSRFVSDYSMGEFQLELVSPSSLQLTYTFLGLAPEPSRAMLTSVALALVILRRRRPERMTDSSFIL